MATDAVTLITSDHRTVEALFSQYEGFDANASEGDADRRRAVVDEIIKELSIHAVIEEMYLYPWITSNVEGGEELVSHALEEHQEVKEILALLQHIDPMKQEYDDGVRAVIENVRHHVEEEEGDFLPRLSEAATQEQLDELGEMLEKAKSTAPTRPHPLAPNTPPGNFVAGAAAGLVDRLRDAMTKDPE